jgi:hypothetical protein
MKKLLAAAALCLVTACSVTDQAKISDVKFSGFLGDYSKLKPTNDPDKVLLRYLDPTANWNSYTMVRLEPVTFWAGSTSSVPLPTQQMLTDYAYQQITAAFKAKGVALTDKSGPGVAVIRVALTDASSATPGLRTISVVVPQARLISAATKLATGQGAFTGSVQSEGEIIDSSTGKLLAAWVDKRFGGSSVENVNVATWGDAEKAIDMWANLIATRTVDLRNGKAI